MDSITVDEVKQMIIGRKVSDMIYCKESCKMQFVLDTGDVVYCRWYWSSEYFGAGILKKDGEFEIELDEQ